MTVVVKFGRRMAHNWARRIIDKFEKLFTFQQNIWVIINGGLDDAIRQCNKARALNKTALEVVDEKYKEKDKGRPSHYFIEWRIIKWTSNIPQEEKDEYASAMKLYGGIKDMFKSANARGVVKEFFGKFKELSRPVIGKGLSADEFDSYVKNVGEDEVGNIYKKLSEAGIVLIVKKE